MLPSTSTNPWRLRVKNEKLRRADDVPDKQRHNPANQAAPGLLAAYLQSQLGVQVLTIYIYLVTVLISQIIGSSSIVILSQLRGTSKYDFSANKTYSGPLSRGPNTSPEGN